MILKALSKHLVSQIKARSIVESCSLYGISVGRTEKTESVFFVHLRDWIRFLCRRCASFGRTLTFYLFL